jgi:hypothetical protein
MNTLVLDYMKQTVVNAHSTNYTVAPATIQPSKSWLLSQKELLAVGSTRLICIVGLIGCQYGCKVCIHGELLDERLDEVLHESKMFDSSNPTVGPK